MKPRFQADADFNEDIVSGILRRIPEIDIQTASEAGFESLSDSEILAIAANDGRYINQPRSENDADSFRHVH